MSIADAYRPIISVVSTLAINFLIMAWQLTAPCEPRNLRRSALGFPPRQISRASSRRAQIILPPSSAAGGSAQSPAGGSNHVLSRLIPRGPSSTPTPESANSTNESFGDSLAIARNTVSSSAIIFASSLDTGRFPSHHRHRPHSPRTRGYVGARTLA